jgi:hypothetical protein
MPLTYEDNTCTILLSVNVARAELMSPEPFRYDPCPGVPRTAPFSIHSLMNAKVATRADKRGVIRV